MPNIICLKNRSQLFIVFSPIHYLYNLNRSFFRKEYEKKSSVDFPRILFLSRKYFTDFFFVIPIKNQKKFHPSSPPLSHSFNFLTI